MKSKLNCFNAVAESNTEVKETIQKLAFGDVNADCCHCSGTL